MALQPVPGFTTAGKAAQRVLRRLTDQQALIERLETAASSGQATNAQRRRLLREAAEYIRNHLPERAA